MRNKIGSYRWLLLVLVLAVAAFPTASASANHSWGKYHWARTSNPFTLNLGNNVSSGWSTYLSTASSDWSVSAVLDTKVVAGSTTGSTCAASSGRVEVCNANYGSTGWLGVAQIWTTRGSHIVQGTAKMNDYYFNQAQYNTAAWRRLVMCQEVAHTFGLDHQDENFNNPNLGTCMDYTNDPDGGGSYGPSNEHPNQHDYDQLVSIYSHLDKTTTVGKALAQDAPAGFANANMHAVENWGEKVSDNGKSAVYVRDFGNGYKVITHVFWATE
jgi:hypothetical protein